MPKKIKTVLSDEDRRLLIEICDYFGSAEIAQRDQGLVLSSLLEELNEDKARVSANLGSTLEKALGKGALRRKREDETKELAAA